MAVLLTAWQCNDKMPFTMTTAIYVRVGEIQQALCEAEIDGWLFYDFRGSDPLAYRILQLDPTIHVTRRWYYWIPAHGAPVKLLHRIEPHVLDALPGQADWYVSWEQQRKILARLLAGGLRVAMQYSPLNAVPYVSRVDAGTIELIRSYNVEVVSSADLIQTFEARWTDRQLESHQFAAVAQGRNLTEYGVQQFILARIREAGMVTSSAPIAAVDAHSADPHYGPTEIGSAEVTRDALLLIDLWAKQAEPGSVYADITWTGYVGRTVPVKHHEIFDVVRRGRDAALAFVRSETAAGHRPFGWEVDDACRQVIQQSGYGDQFVHRTGHSIGEEVHGNGANIDGLETQDTRRLIPRTCFSIEPGIYLPGEFGIRSELDVYLAEREVLVFGLPLQNEIVPLF